MERSIKFITLEVYGKAIKTNHQESKQPDWDAMGIKPKDPDIDESEDEWDFIATSFSIDYLYSTILYMYEHKADPEHETVVHTETGPLIINMNRTELIKFLEQEK